MIWFNRTTNELKFKFDGGALTKDETYGLQFTGTIIMGKLPTRNQELCNHYMAPLTTHTLALKCMKEIEHECFKMGLPLKTRHQEFAPGQFESALECRINTVQIDWNLIVMQFIEEVIAKHGLAALLHETPFAGINGLGKHNNWSLSIAATPCPTPPT